MTQWVDKAVVLLSGGLDSACTAALAKERGFSLYGLTLAYGQRHEIETSSARRVADSLGLEDWKVHHLDLRAFGGSALTDAIDVPKSNRVEDLGEGIPVTYVPARNTIFLAVALGYAEVLGADDIFIGVNAVDYSGYPDCRPEFVAAFQSMARLATKSGVEGSPITIHTPLARMTKAQIVKEGHRLGVDFSLTHSCYDPASDGSACGSCDSCLLRLKGFEEAGCEDPIDYMPGVAKGQVSS